MNEDNKNRLLTLTAFTIGFIFTEKFTSTEQNAIGGFFMLIGQTLSTNASFKFNKDWKSSGAGSQIDEKELLKRVRKVFNDVVDEKVK